MNMENSSHKLGEYGIGGYWKIECQNAYVHLKNQTSVSLLTSGMARGSGDSISPLHIGYGRRI